MRLQAQGEQVAEHTWAWRMGTPLRGRCELPSWSAAAASAWLGSRGAWLGCGDGVLEGVLRELPLGVLRSSEVW